MRVVAIACLFALTACPGPVVTRDRIERVSVPVTVPCVSGERPAAVAPLKGQMTTDQWKALTLKQKAENVSAQALRHQSYGQAISAATGACK